MIKLQGISKEELVTLVQLSSDIYNGSHGEPIYSPVGSNIEYTEVNGIKVGYGNYNGGLLFVFKGTDGTLEWINNVNFYQSEITYKPKSKERVEGGFFNQYRMLRSWVRNKIDLNRHIPKVYLVGHSLGAAVTQLCAHDISEDIPHLVEIISVAVASPRVGNSYFAKALNRRVPLSYRIKYREDIVTKVPWDILMNYSHSSNYRIWLNKPTMWWKLRHPSKSFFGVPRDHYPQNYVCGVMSEVVE